MATGAVDSKTAYVGGLYEASASFCSTPSALKQYRAFGRIIAQRSGSTVRYLLADHLGSTVGRIDGSTIVRQSYWPFGSERSNTGGSVGDKAYTGQQREPTSINGLYYYHARFYSTELGHFMSADPLTADGLNRYAYVRNNPLRYNDPTGLHHDCGRPGGEVCPPQGPIPPLSPGADYDQWACGIHIDACMDWVTGSLRARFGSAAVGLVIVMGFNQSDTEFMVFSEFIRLFWDTLMPGACGGIAAIECYAGLNALVSAGRARDAFSIFGVMLIETYPRANFGFIPLEGVFDRVNPFQSHLDGYDTLNWAIRDSGIDVQAVIGFSSGAATVSQWYGERIGLQAAPFFLIEPWGPGGVPIDPGVDVRALQHASYRGYFPPNSCRGGDHCTHNYEALTVIEALLP